MTHVSHTEQVRLSKRQVAHRSYSLAASEPQYSVSQEQAEMANVSKSGCTEAFEPRNRCECLALWPPQSTSEQVRLCTTLAWRTGATFYAILRLRKSRFCAGSAIHSPLWPGEALQDARLAHRCDVFAASEAPEEPVLSRFCDTFPTLGLSLIHI